MINKNDFNLTIKKIFTERVQHAKQVAEDNLNLALKNETLRKSFYKVRSLQIDLSKVETNSKTAKQIEQQIESERIVLRQELKNCNLTKEDLKPQFLCKKCCDTGFVNGEKCSCYKAEQNKLYLAECGINKSTLPSFKNINFNIFNKNKDDIQKIYSLTKTFTEKKDGTKQTIVIHGKTGVGKTYLTECALENAISNDIYTIYTTAFKMNEDFLQYHIAKFEDKQGILTPYLTSDLLIIDDLGSENKLKNVTSEYLYLILDTRTRNGLKTIVTTNLTPEQIQDKYDDRVFSRLFNKQIGILLSMPGEDLRFKK